MAPHRHHAALRSMAVGIDTNVSKRWGARATGVVLGLWLGACGSDDERPPAWDPELDDDGDGEASTSTGEGTTGGGPVDPGEGDGSTGGTACMPGQVIDCDCPDGGAGQQVCTPDGAGFGVCECDDAGSTGDESGTTGEPPPEENEVCYPGENNDFTTCLPLHAFAPLPAGYEYPPPYMGDPNYRPPVALLDLEEVDPGTWLAPNFQLGELAQLDKGRYAVVQVHAVVSLQALRDEVGALGVNSGYRSPAYNAGIPGSATNSRHMFGDGFDLEPIEVGLTMLENACTAHGGALVEYTTHVHCDFRYDPVDEEFYGPVMAVSDPEPPQYEADLVLGDDGIWRAPAEGFDEGEPQRRWTARDAAGQVIATAVGAELVAPVGTVTVEVRVGAQVERAAAVP
jgi:Peptidase M15